MKNRISNTSARRERRITVRKNQILEAAIILFCEKGYHRTTTKDIALAADISEGTIYNYFTSKEDLLIEIMSRLSSLDELEDPPAGDPVEIKEFFRSVVKRHLSFLQKNFPALRAVLSEILVNPLVAERYYRVIIAPTQERLEEQLRRGVEHGQIRAVEVSLIARILVAETFGLFFLESMGDPLATDLDKVSTVLTDILFDGIHPKSEKR